MQPSHYKFIIVLVKNRHVYYIIVIFIIKIALQPDQLGWRRPLARWLLSQASSWYGCKQEEWRVNNSCDEEIMKAKYRPQRSRMKTRRYHFQGKNLDFILKNHPRTRFYISKLLIFPLKNLRFSTKTRPDPDRNAAIPTWIDQLWYRIQDLKIQNSWFKIQKSSI